MPCLLQSSKKYKQKLKGHTGSSGDQALSDDHTGSSADQALTDDSIEKYIEEKLANWKIALKKAGSLCGWHLSNGDESHLIQRIVEATLSKLNRTLLHIAKYPVGIERRLKNLGTNAIEGIKLDLPEPKTLYSSAKAFKKMKRLRMLILRNVVLSTVISYLPSELRFIDWPGYKFPTLPLNPGPKQLVILDMPQSYIQQLGEAFKELCLIGSAIKELPSSLENLVALGVLNLTSCRKLERIPCSIYRLHHLKHLGLGGCSKLFKFPKNISKICPSMEFILNTSISNPFGSFPMLKFLDLQNCNLLEAEFLMTDPNGFCNLEVLNLAKNKFVSLPSTNRFTKLRYLFLNDCEFLQNIPELPGNLTHLDASDCKSLLEPCRFIMTEIIRNKKPSKLSNFHRFADQSSNDRGLFSFHDIEGGLIEVRKTVDFVFKVEVIDFAI
ncbi:hypothetical protein FEM48_Zijuj07G0002500 [Ziziphus jujuba var. spinosa]|uniref:Disease resistance protein RPS4B/Roq1-like leucine-rich repeats domain-containing protein n=1 Tax=Ziziphus jujuba var. spinosa TaxID=714518 RepID=A0A978V1B5_ZIZJJ|nr:hypothetical protein FEM48_Zijuj07G0002500 [Ziziphus jujuba var. spinosa]